ncbi:hypothetical protein E4631_11480 [Hymenobacter sp. UV11]|uniref:hypothetical protein n=1 Tax=Hymenobacter sp. UV11 TaxID=1849735 RepID=UPI00105B26B9|nr:hypothetical protein [Hymenobacter sp. UV11]TDN40373.1 hypothetical protein A8B98_13075 [Hymenobacter sp. UV11]TFZ66624.1 hypothetical protein E4631_11480 [Hymenobacter sp. UV11]
MRLALAILLNLGLLTGLGIWLRAAYRAAAPRLRRWLLPALAWRLLLTAIGTQFPESDMVYAVINSKLIASVLWEQPARALVVLQNASFTWQGAHFHMYAWSNTLFWYKIIALLSLATGGQLWLDALYLSIGCFIGCWYLVRALAQTLPATPAGAGLVAFLLWPTLVWWTNGLTKETLLVGTGAGFVALALPVLYGSGLPRRFWLAVGQLVGGLLLAWVMVRMRYYFALPLVGGVLALAAVRRATRRGWLRPAAGPQVGALLLLLTLAGAVAGALGGEQMELTYFSHEVDANYHHGLLTSPNRPHVTYADWDPTPLGLLRHAPLAAAQVLVRPWLGESALPLYVGAALENALLLALVLLALVAAGQGRGGRLPVALTVLLLVYCLLLAAFIGLSTPNFGTLSRYRAGLLPWLLLLLLQNDYARQVLKRLV